MTDLSELHKLSADLQSGANRVGKDGANVVREYGDKVRDTAKGMAPIRTGALRESIEANMSGDGRSGDAAAIVGTFIRQGAFQEFGTSKMAAQPFLAPALGLHSDGFTQAVLALTEDLL